MNRTNILALALLAPIVVVATNTFTAVARCNQTYPKRAAGSCPDPAPCPK